MNLTVSQHFSSSYASARQKFLAAAELAKARLDAHVHPAHKGVEGEQLAMDVALIGDPQARNLLVVSSGMHGVEGYCGSGCQIALLHDDELLGRLGKAQTALLLIHAINPYGFSHVRRVNEDNIDLNRNFLDFEQDLPQNAEYGEVHPLLFPQSWPPGQAYLAALQGYVQQYGLDQFNRALTIGQHTHPDGVFYSGRAPAWSNTTLRSVLGTYGAQRQAIAWIDIHTGLGPQGHGEKIFGSETDAGSLQRARACWGADVFSPYNGESASQAVRGSGTSSLATQCPQARTICLGLEFGTLPMEAVKQALIADHWLAKNPQADAALRAAIKAGMKAAFYVDSDEWRGMVSSQNRVACLQAIAALSAGLQ